MHEAQLRDDVTVDVAPGGVVRERWVPVRRVGLYVPGGLVAYPSSVVMNVVPAQVAGVESIALASPPQQDFGGLPHPAVLAACALLGIDEVYAVGRRAGHRAVCLRQHRRKRRGGRTGRRRHRPGQHLRRRRQAGGQGRGRYRLPRPARPRSASWPTTRPTRATLPPISSPRPSTTSWRVACWSLTRRRCSTRSIANSIRQVPATRHVGRVEAALAGQSAYVLVDDIEAGLRVVDAWAAEHLEVVTRDARVGRRPRAQRRRDLRRAMGAGQPR